MNERAKQASWFNTISTTEPSSSNICCASKRFLPRKVRPNPCLSPFDEVLLCELRERQLREAGRAKLRERVAVEHALAHIGHWQGQRARYRGTSKNLFDLQRNAVVHIFHVLARVTALSNAA